MDWCIRLIRWCNGVFAKFAIMVVGVVLISLITIVHTFYGD